MAINMASLGTFGWFTDTGGVDIVPSGEEIHTLGFFSDVAAAVVATGLGMPPRPKGRGFTKQYLPIIPGR
jgi:hypothetical protein